MPINESTENPYGNYDEDGLTPQLLLAMLMSMRKRISSTISDVKRFEDEVHEKQSKIEQTIDSISLEVLDIQKNAEGSNERIGKLEVRADKIDLTVSDITENVAGNLEKIGKLEVRADSISQTVSEVTTTLNGTVTRVGRLETRADGIDLTVANVTTTLNGATSDISSLKIRANSIESTVSSMDSRLGSAESQISQTAYQLQFKVSESDYNGDTIASMINQSASRIQISAQAIDLQGITNVASQLTLGTGMAGYASIRFNGQANIYTYNGSDLYFSAASTNMQDGTVFIDRLWFGRSLYYESGYLTAPSGSLSISQNTVKANTITELSNADFKKNIQDWEHNALEMILSTPIRQYQYKTELDNEFPHVGIIVQEAPVWVVEVEGEGIEPYKMSVLSWKAIQELNAKIDELKGMVDNGKQAS